MSDLPETALPLAGEATGDGAAAATPASVATTDPTPAAAPTATEIDWDRISTLDPDELLTKHPKLRDTFEGRAGRLAQQRAEQIANAQLAQERQRMWVQMQQEQQRARLAELRESDPYAYVEEQKRHEAQGQSAQQLQAAHAQAAMAAIAAYDQNVTYRLIEDLPADATAELARKQYANGYEGRLQFAKDVRDLHAKTVVDRTTAELRSDYDRRWSEREAALRKELLGQEAENEGDVDTGGGSAAGGTVLTKEKWKSLGYEGRARLKAENPQAVQAMWDRGG